MTEINNSDKNQNVITEPVKLIFKNINALYKAYMPYLQNAGLFIAHPSKFTLGDKVPLHVVLPGVAEEQQVYEIEGTVAWITPTAAHGRWITGIGVEFSAKDNGRKLREKINSLLLENSESGAPTSTM